MKGPWKHCPACSRRMQASNPHDHCGNCRKKDDEAAYDRGGDSGGTSRLFGGHEERMRAHTERIQAELKRLEKKPTERKRRREAS